MHAVRSVAGRRLGLILAIALQAAGATDRALRPVRRRLRLLLVLARGLVHRRLLGPALLTVRAGRALIAGVPDLSAGEFVAAIIGLLIGLLMGLLLGLPLSNFPDPYGGCCRWASRSCSGWA